jgi:tetratricopeptide (TPR) repeat protein
MSAAPLRVVCILLALVQGPAPGPSASPREVVRQAIRAVQGDSAAPLLRRWTTAARNPADRAAMLGLATLARLRYEYPAAESTYRRLTAGAPDAYSVYARLGLSDGFETRALSQFARREMDSALALARAIGHGPAQGEAFLELAFMRGRLEGVDVAAALLDSAAARLPPDDLSLQAGWKNRNAIVLALRGKAAEASREAEAAMALARRAGDPAMEATAWRVAGQIYQYRASYDSALSALQQSESLYVKARSRSALAASLIWHAQVLANRGRYGDMRAVMVRALAEGKATHNPDAVADAHRSFGVLAGMLGDWPSAAAHLKQSAAISISQGDSASARTTRTFQANAALATGDLALARRLTEEELHWAVRVKDANAIFTAQRGLADILAREGDFPAAFRALDSARAALKNLPGTSYRYWVDHDEARLALRRGDLATAERLLTRYIAASGGPQNEITRFDSRVRLADVYGRLGKLEAAEAELTAATDDIERWRNRIGDAGLRTFAFQTVATSAAAAAEPGAAEAGAARVIAVLARGGRAESAFYLAERWRARELIDRMARAQAFRAGVPSPADSGFRPAARRAADLAAALPDERTALVEYVVAPGVATTVFVVQRSGLRAAVLEPDTALAAQVARFTGLVESGADAARLGRALAVRYLDPVLGLLEPRVTRLVLVPDGPLHRLPFDALRLGDGRYAVERYALGLAPSASIVAGLWAASPRRPDSAVKILAFGNPVPPMPPSDSAAELDGNELGAAVQAAGGLSRLTGAAREARLVAGYAPAELRLGASAGAAFLKQADLTPYRVIHFATHAIVSDRSLAGTALVLAPGEGEAGLVGPGDLAALKLDADLVVLSACRAAGGTVTTGEGVQGLTSPLLQAGARSLVATAWRIRDRDAVPFVESLYDRLASGLPVVEALQAAKLAQLRSGGSPRTWAAFLSIGDPFVTVPLQAPGRLRRWWARVASLWS